MPQSIQIRENKIFVTGGAGFIGSHLVDRFRKEGKEVTVYDNLVTGKEELIAHHFGKPGFSFLKEDLLDFNALKQAMKGHEVVFHLGANTDIPKGNSIVDLDLKNCTVATHNVLEAMRQNGLKKIVFSSSGTVYGETPPISLKETYGPLLPISLYGAGKLACEGLISAYCHLFDMQGWIFRFANVVGARMGHGVIFDFIHKLQRNPKELEILGDGYQEKPFFLVEDCIEGMLCAFRNSSEQFDVFNLGCNTATRVTTVAQIVADEMGLKNVSFRFTGGRRGWPGDVPFTHFDLDKMKRLGWTPRYTSDEAVRIAARRLLGREG